MSSKNKVKKVIPLKGGLDVTRTDRPDIAANRADSSTFIAVVDKPLLNNKEEWVKRSYANGIELKAIVEGSGLKVSHIYSLVGLDPMLDKSRYESLVEHKNTLVMKAR